MTINQNEKAYIKALGDEIYMLKVQNRLWAYGFLFMTVICIITTATMMYFGAQLTNPFFIRCLGS
jgi:hypothetical protein